MSDEKQEYCPLLHRPCIKDGAVVDGKLISCKFWVRVMGRNPQTGADVDHHDCTLAWIPVLLIDNSKQQRETGAAVESFRNEMVKANETNQQVLLTAAKIAASEADSITLLPHRD